MWLKIILLLILIELSEEKCKTYFIGNHTPHSILCTGISPYYDLQEDILLDYPMADLTIRDSNIPELGQHLFLDVKFKSATIQANVEVIQDEAFENCKISSLTLDHNDIKVIKDRSFNSASINFLSLQNNSLSGIKSSDFYGLSKLRRLDLKYNNISDIEEDSFDSLLSLDELDLSFNRIEELHFGQFRHVTALESIYLNNNLLKGLSDHMFSNCKALKYINIENNFITVIDAKQYPNSVLSINASNNQLLSVDFSNLINLDTLTLSFNNLKYVTDSLYNLTSLKYLYLNYNSLGPSVEAKIFQYLKNLTAINLDGNGLQEIKLDLTTSMPSLQTISLAANNLTSLDLSNFNANVTELILCKNSLHEIKNLSNMQVLEELDLSYNNLRKIEYDTFKNMNNLKQLKLKGNLIYTVTLGCFRDLRQLQELDLSHNKIDSLGVGSFTGLDQIINLNISYNNLSYIDQSIFNSTRNLQSLDISYNILNNFEIQPMLLSSPFLKNINLAGNNWTCKFLTDFFILNKYELTHGTSYNVTNVFGIPCNDINNNKQYIQLYNSTNSVTYSNSIEGHVKEISIKMTIIIVVLIIMLVLNWLKFIFVKCFSCFTAAKQFFYKRYSNEQEIQLM